MTHIPRAGKPSLGVYLGDKRRFIAALVLSSMILAAGARHHDTIFNIASRFAPAASWWADPLFEPLRTLHARIKRVAGSHSAFAATVPGKTTTTGRSSSRAGRPENLNGVNAEGARDAADQPNLWLTAAAARSGRSLDSVGVPLPGRESASAPQTRANVAMGALDPPALTDATRRRADPEPRYSKAEAARAKAAAAGAREDRRTVKTAASKTANLPHHRFGRLEDARDESPADLARDERAPDLKNESAGKLTRRLTAFGTDRRRPDAAKSEESKTEESQSPAVPGRAVAAGPAAASPSMPPPADVASLTPEPPKPSRRPPRERAPAERGLARPSTPEGQIDTQGAPIGTRSSEPGVVSPAGITGVRGAEDRTGANIAGALTNE
ncbi:MAG: hypothetical protein HY059_18880 [Proteobacteria bacterium]|nr:hypothetical protein [Pseudomonadota bacterium]